MTIFVVKMLKLTDFCIVIVIVPCLHARKEIIYTACINAHSRVKLPYTDILVSNSSCSYLTPKLRWLLLVKETNYN